MIKIILTYYFNSFLKISTIDSIRCTFSRHPGYKYLYSVFLTILLYKNLPSFVFHSLSNLDQVSEGVIPKKLY